MPTTADLFQRLRRDAGPTWRRYVGHRFVEGLGDGSLPEAAFRHYLTQDYLFLIHFARAYALAVYKSSTLDEMRRAHAGLKAILDVEMDLHVRICARWGVTPSDLEVTPEAGPTMAYTRYVLETGVRGDLLDLEVALAPCILGYAEIGRTLAQRPGAMRESNPYREWIAEYAGEAFQTVAAEAEAELDRLARHALTEARYPRLLKIFDEATRLEIDFWDMGLSAAKL